MSYSSYDHDDLEPASTMRIERRIYFESGKADLSGAYALADRDARATFVYEALTGFAGRQHAGAVRRRHGSGRGPAAGRGNACAASAVTRTMRRARAAGRAQLQPRWRNW